MITQDRRLLVIGIAASLILHAALLALRFDPPASERARPFNTGLSVILVNAKHDHAPLQPEALAQANLEGGGDHQAGRARSPLPQLGRVNDGAQLEAQRQRVTDLARGRCQLILQRALVVVSHITRNFCLASSHRLYLLDRSHRPVIWLRRIV